MLHVVPLRPADDIVQQLRNLADRIEQSAMTAQEVLCIVRMDTNNADVYSWGDYRGQIAALGLIEAAKRRLDVNTEIEESGE